MLDDSLGWDVQHVGCPIQYVENCHDLIGGFPSSLVLGTCTITINSDFSFAMYWTYKLEQTKLDVVSIGKGSLQFGESRLQRRTSRLVITYLVNSN